MEGIIIYKGKYGATMQYAEWLAAALQLPFAVADDIGKAQLANYDFLVLGSSVYVGKMLIKDWIRQNLTALQGKKIFLFIVSGTPASKKEKLGSYVQDSVPAEIMNSCETYFLPGRLITKTLSLLDRLMLKIGSWLAKGEEAKKEIKMEYNEVKKENIKELVNDITKFYSNKILS
jgi:menaquinone-dependent protoporphyrinogen IX oxidase